MANLRFEVVAEAFKKRPVEVEAPKVRPSEYFAKYVFNRQKMYKYLPANVYEKLVDVIDNGARLDRNIADAVAKGIKAGDLVKNVCTICGGKGGGKPDSAMGGGTDLLKVDDALAAVDDFVAEKLK